MSSPPAPRLPPDHERPAPGRVRRAATWLAAVATDNAEGAVYGAVMIGVLLAAEDGHHETYGETIAAAAVVLLIYWVTALYTHVLGVRLRTQQTLERGLVLRSIVHELPVLEGAVMPMIALLVAWLARASLSIGLRWATFVTALSIVALEVAAGWRARPRGGSMWLRASLGAIVGLAIVSVKVVLHV